MKKFIFSLAALLLLTVSAKAMSYEQARQQAIFLTDKMAYELNLTDDQYEAAYEINLDYLMSINSYDDLYGIYWRRRNLDLSYILLDWQYKNYCAANYFYRPLYWDDGYWRFRVYARYPQRDYFYFSQPRFYTIYRGEHSWRVNGNRSWYYGRSYGMRDDRQYVGMRDNFNRGYYGNGYTYQYNNNTYRYNDSYQNNRTFGGDRNVRLNSRGVTNNNSFGGNNNNRSYPNNNDNSTYRSRNFGGSAATSPRSNDNFGYRESSTRTTAPAQSGVFGGYRGGTSTVPNNTFQRSGSSGSFGSSNQPTRTFGGSNTSPRSFGGNNTTRSFGSSSQPSRPSMNSNGTVNGTSGVFGGRR